MRSRARRATCLTGLAVVAAIAAFAGLADDDGATAAGSPSAAEVERDALAQSDHVQGAPNRELVLSRVVVPPGAYLALHHHLGTQVAHVESGVLTYTVRQGSVVVSRGQSDEDPTVVRTIGPARPGAIKAGQWIVEQPSDIHRGREPGRETGRDLPRHSAEGRGATGDAGCPEGTDTQDRRPRLH